MPISRQAFAAGPKKPPPTFDWFHIVLTAYGTWLPGDPRGFRTRNHRQHVEGDYKSPPKEDYSGLHAKSALQMTHAPTRLVEDYREILGLALIEKLRRLGGFVLTAAVMEAHVHLLAKLPTDEARKWVGRAKKHAWFEMRDVGWQSKLWAKGAKVTPVRDLAHQRNCFRYIVRHHRQGGWVWVWEGLNDAVVDKVLNESQ